MHGVLPNSASLNSTITALEGAGDSIFMSSFSISKPKGAVPLFFEDTQFPRVLT